MSYSFRWGVPVLDEGNTEIPNLFFRRYAKFVTGPEWLFILHLATYKYESPKGECRPSLLTIAKEMDLHVNTVRGYKKSLVDKGFLQVSPRPGRPNLYDFSALSKAMLAYTPTQASTPTPESTPPLHEHVPLPLHPSVGEEEVLKEENQDEEAPSAQSPPDPLPPPPSRISEDLLTLDYGEIHAERSREGRVYVARLYRNSHYIKCEECDNEWDWPSSKKGRRSESARTCLECGAHHIVHGESSSGTGQLYGDAYEYEMFWDIHTPRMPIKYRRLSADTFSLEEYLRWWSEDPDLVIRMGGWAERQEWSMDLAAGEAIKKIIAACITADKKPLKASPRKPPKTVPPPLEEIVVPVTETGWSSICDLPED